MIEEIKKRLENTTPGDWVKYGYEIRAGMGHSICLVNSRGLFWEGDREFITYAKDDIEWLLKRVEELEEYTGYLKSDEGR